MQDNWPLVTAFTLIYNTNPNYVINAIESIRANCYPNLQHIIIDDCSTDPLPKEIIRQWIKDNNYDCEFYEHSINYGLCKTLNHVLELAKGKYYFGCSDDLITGDKIKSQVALFESLSEDYAMVYSDALIKDDSGNDLGSILRNYRNMNVGPEGYIFEDLYLGNFIHLSAALVRTSCHKMVGGFNESLLIEDIDMYLRIAQRFKIKFDTKPRAIYRVNRNSLLSTIGVKGLDQNLESLFPYYNYNALTRNYFISYLESSSTKLHEANYYSWRKWYRIRWQILKDGKGLFYYLVSILNVQYSLVGRLNQFVNFLKRSF